MVGNVIAVQQNVECVQCATSARKLKTNVLDI